MNQEWVKRRARWDAWKREQKIKALEVAAVNDPNARVILNLMRRDPATIKAHADAIATMRGAK